MGPKKRGSQGVIVPAQLLLVMRLVICTYRFLTPPLLSSDHAEFRQLNVRVFQSKLSGYPTLTSRLPAKLDYATKLCRASWISSGGRRWDTAMLNLVGFVT